MPAPASTVGRQLADALDETGVSARELARRLSDSDGSKLESKRRWIQKVLADELERPAMEPVAAALSLPTNYFRVPPPARRDRSTRLEELEAEVSRLRQELDAFVQAATVRMDALEAAPATATRRSGRQSKPRSQ